FFKQNDSFDMDDFARDVIGQPEVIDSFRQYKEQYEEQYDVQLPDSFGISEGAVKKQARAYKSVIKLDKNFHIYVHGDRKLIEQGEDEKGKFYKVYYNEES
ncbi:MAG: nucleoid-associated protein, partial [Bacteroidaceae bacterium]|nr:nucleoid-associated protein [Bacteroidaceae bacterium]